MATYDKLDWHFDSAIDAGQPPENAFTHIGFYLAWLIRHDLHNPRTFPSDHIEAVKRREMTGSDLADDIDTKLTSEDTNAEGRAFSDARYSTYVSEYQGLFPNLPDYGVVDDGANYEQVEQVLDRLYADWVAEGRPKPPPEAESAVDLGIDVPVSATVMFPPDFTRDEIDAFLGEYPGEIEVMPRPTREQRPHAAPELEALIPVDLTTPSMEVSSVRASDFRSSLLNRVLRRLEVRPRDAVVVHSMGGSGETTLTVVLYGVPGIEAGRLETEFQSVIYLPPGSKWARRTVGGREVNWASSQEFTVAYWTRDGLVVHVAGDTRDLETAIQALL